jgi:AcrR family transcriptional regulator
VAEARIALTPERVVRAAVTIIERDGAEALSMRRVAAELGAAPMSLYNHVPNKAALLDKVAEFIMADMEFAADPNADWRDQARSMARTFHAVARRYPRSIQVVITRHPKSAAGVRPMELALAAVRGAGFDDQTSVLLVRTFISFIRGSLMSEARPTLSNVSEMADSMAGGELRHVRELLPLLAVHDHQGEFEFGLELLISAMSALPHREGDDIV